MPPCKFFLVLTRAFAASTPAGCRQVKASLLASPFYCSPLPPACRSWRKHGGRSVCMVLESCISSKAVHGWLDDNGQLST